MFHHNLRNETNKAVNEDIKKGKAIIVEEKRVID